MKTNPTKSTTCLPTRHLLSRPTANFWLGTLAAAALPFAEGKAWADEAQSAPPPSRVNFLVDLTLSSHYLTPRGMDVSDQGLVLQPLILVLANVYKSDGFLNDITLVGGVWNCFGTAKLPSSTSAQATRTGWYEIDPIAGISIGLAKNFKLSVTYTAFDMQIYNIPFSQHLETKLSYDDSGLLKAFALHPYVIFWQELNNKAVSISPGSVSKESYYFDVGIAPGYTFKKFGSVKLEAPCRLLMANEDFYGTAAGDTPVVSLYEIGLKASMPLPFISSSYGHWSANLGVKYMNFQNPNLKITQNESSSTVVYGGLSMFF